MDATITAHADPVGEAPWAMQLVVHVEKQHPPTHTAALTATASACVLLLAQIETTGSDTDTTAVARWRTGRIRKVVRRARGTAWTNAPTGTPTYHLHTGPDAEVLACLPTPVDQVPPALAKLQVSGLTLTDPDSPPAPAGEPAPVTVHLNPHVPLSTGKAAAQVAHAAQLVYETTSGPARDQWVRDGAPVHLATPDPDTWTLLCTHAPVRVTDAGFTEIPAGTTTCLATHTLD